MARGHRCLGALEPTGCVSGPTFALKVGVRCGVWLNSHMTTRAGLMSHSPAGLQAHVSVAPLAAAGCKAVMSTMLLGWLAWRIGCHCLLPALPAMVAYNCAARVCAYRVHVAHCRNFTAQGTCLLQFSRPPTLRGEASFPKCPARLWEQRIQGLQMPKWHWAHCLCKPHGQGPQMPRGTGTHWSCVWTNVRKQVEGPLWRVAQQSHDHRGWAHEPQHPSAAGTGVCSRLAAAGGKAVTPNTGLLILAS